jgi:hypothetical protein
MILLEVQGRHTYAILSLTANEGLQLEMASRSAFVVATDKTHTLGLWGCGNDPRQHKCPLETHK